MGKVLGEYTLSCDYLFMAAGSIGTTELLLKARELGELPNLSDHIGEGWGSNGDSACVRIASPSIGLAQASPSASKINDTVQGLPVTLENWYALHVPADITAIAALGMVYDPNSRASFEYDPTTDKTTLMWPKDGNKAAVEATRELHNKIAQASWSIPGVPGLVPDVNAGFTAHPLGGAILGKAADAYGRVDGYDQLYVMDGAMVNGSTGAVNPSLTISALAERNIEHIVQHDF